MKNTKKKLNKILSVVLALTIAFSMFSGLTFSAAIIGSGKTADISTMDSWKVLFPEDNTEQAGRVWTDKSVFTNADAFQNLRDANGRRIDISMNDPDDNFLVALSALASNKSIVGYSYTPTDTMLILDASASMGNSSYVDDLVTAANDAIKELLALNRHNRVGVVLYSGSTQSGNSNGDTATVLLPLDRYTHSSNTFLTNNGQNSISINSRVQNEEQQGTNRYMTQSSKNVAGGTYIQNGVYMAMEQFLEVEDTIIPDGQHQAGTTRTPIFVLMSDGEPTTATTYINGRTGNNQIGIGTSNLGNGATINDEVLYDVVDFVNQLTAANAIAQVDAHYNAATPLFYTLGLGANNQALNSSVLNPSGFTNTDTLWRDYIGTANGSNFITDIEEEDHQGRADQGSIVKLDTITSIEQKNYATEYFKANNASGLISAFDDIVNQIIIQSLYYPTLVEDGDYDHDGYIEFIDDIGHYMDVKDIKGITMGDELFTGERLAANFTPSGGELVNPDGSYSELGDNMVWSVMDRLGIATAEDARDLINSAYETGQLRYNEQTGEWSNFIGWYADDEGNFMGHWHEGHTDADKPAGATFINRSYGMLGEVTAGHAATDMMYVSTQVHTRIADGHVSFIWRVPASLIPVVSYNITLNGETVKDATRADIEYNAAEPIRVIFEVGLIDEINAVNLNTMVADQKEHILDVNNDGVSDDGKYYFYTNWWNDDKISHENPPKTEDTIVFFEPSIQNERYYYAEETAVYVKTGDNSYQRYSGVMPNPTDGNTYYREYVIFDGNDIIFQHEEMSDDTISVLKAENQNADGTWDIPMGTVHRVLEPYNLEKQDKTLTATLDYVRYPVIEEIPEKHSFYIGSILGNNGRIAVDIPQGIKIAKLVDETLYGTDEIFNFTVSTEGISGEVEAYKELADGTLNYSPVTFTNGTAQISMKASEAVYMIGLDEAVYTINEIIDGDYKVSSVTVNGVVQNNTSTANITVEQYELGEVVFENTLDVADNTIVITKEIVHDDALTYNEDQEYTFEFYNKATPDDKETFTIKADQTKTFGDLVDGTYVVNEINIPAGYAPRNNNIEVTVTDGAVVPVHFINDYTPGEIKPSNLTVSGTKTLNGRDWQEGDNFSFKLQRLEGTSWIDIAERTVAYGDSDYDYMFDFSSDADLADVAFTTVGTHYFRIYEVVPTEKPGGIIYDTNYRYFHINVTDAEMDGYLEIAKVEANAPVSVTSTGSDANIVWNVDVDFTNTYSATGADDIIVTIDKTVTDRVGAGTGKDGFTFGLYTVGGTAPIMESAPTDENGHTAFNLTFPATAVGRTYNFEIREIVPEEKVEGMIYVETPVPVTIEIVDNLDGTVTAVVTTDAGNSEDITVGFENVYDPADVEVTLSGTKVMEGRDFDTNEFTFELYEDGNDSPKTATNDAKANGGTFTFEKLTFGNIGTYGYTIKENKGTLGGVKYSDKVYDVQIIVTDDTDNDGKLNAEVKIDGVTVVADAITGAVVFENIYTTASVDVTLEATKTLDGRDLKDGEFNFAIKDIDNDTVVQDDAINDADGNVVFDTLTFDAAGTYNYVVYENEENGNGVTVDKTQYAVTITVTDNGQGQLSAEVKVDGTVVIGSTANVITFKNTYSISSVDVVLEATKTLTGRELKDGEFNFALMDVDNEQVVQFNATNDADGKVVFDALTFDKAGTYNYIAYEYEVDRNGVTIDKTQHKIVIVVADNGDGRLAATVNGIAADAPVNIGTFNNIYNAGNVTVVLEATKILTGRDLKDGEFNFALMDVDNEQVVQFNATNDADGKIVFDALTFDKAGTYNYVAYEYEVDHNGVTIDTTQHKVVIVVTDNNKGQLVATVNGIAADAPVNVGTFTNIYKAASVDVVLEATKTLTGRDLVDGEFKFDLYDADNGVIKQDDVKLVLQPDGKGKITFEKLNFDKVGVYNYLVYEDEIDGNGITIDLDRYSVTVTVTDNGEGNLVAEVKVDGIVVNGSTANAIVFDNKYHAASAKVTLEATKTITGRELRDGEFKFDLKDIDADAIVQDDVKLVLQENGSGKIAFEELVFDKAGVYNYTVYEDEVDANGVTVDKAVYEITVTVTDNKMGFLVAVVKVNGVEVEGSTADAIVFENTYTAASVDVTLEATKTLTGRDVALGNEEFKFAIKDLDKNNIVQDDATNNAEGKVVFDTLTFDKVGVYNYVIYENEENANGITVDKTEYNVTITVTDNGNGNLVADVNGTVFEGTAINVGTFNNTYKAASVQVNLEASKTLSGRNTALKDKEFKFALAEKDGTVVQDNATNNVSGIVVFNTLTFDKVGTYEYVVYENEVDGNGITVDKAQYNVTIVVTDNNKGQLVATVNGIDADGATINVGSFTNIYKAQSTSVTLEATKTLTGRDLIDGEFKFDLYDVDNDKVLQDNVALSLQADGSGKIAFAEITFDTAGTYKYVVYEDEVNENGITVDTTRYDVTIVVTDDNKGQLNAKVYVGNDDVDGSTAEAIVFKNAYNAINVDVTIEAVKTIIGRDLVDAEFKFALKDVASGMVVQDDATNDSEGKVVFDTLTFDKVGEYEYVVYENEVDGNGVTVDTTEYKVVIVVTDNGKGNLVAEVKVDGTVVTGSTADVIVFENSYKAEATEIAISAKKLLDGRELRDGEFEFELWLDNELLESVKNDADGNIVFQNVAVDSAGEYILTVKEARGDDKDITYDETVYTVTVNVIDNLDGTYSVEYLYKNGTEEVEEIVFNNKYTEPTPEPQPEPTPEPEPAPEEEPESPKTGDNLNLTGWLAVVFVSGAIIFATGKKLKRLRK